MNTKIKSTIVSKLIACLSLIAMCVPSASAFVTGNWSADADGAWSGTGNWSGSVVPGYSPGDTANLNFNFTAAHTVTMDFSPTNGILNIGDPTGPNYYGYTILTNSSTTALKFDNAGAGAQLNQLTASGVTDVISAPIILVDNLTVNNKGVLIFNGQITNGPTTTGRTLTFNGSGNAGTNVIYQPINNTILNVAGGTVVLGTNAINYLRASNGVSPLTISSGATLVLDITGALGGANNPGGSVGMGKLNGQAGNGSTRNNIVGGGTLRLVGNTNDFLGWNANPGGYWNIGLTSGAKIDIQGGTFANGGWGAINWVTNQSDMNIGPNGGYDIWDGANTYVDKLTGTGRIVDNGGSSSGVNSRMMVVGVLNGSSTFDGVIGGYTPGGNATPTGLNYLGVQKMGIGTFTLTATNTYRNGTIVSGGTVIIPATTRITASTSGEIRIGDQNSLLLNPSNAPVMNLYGVASSFANPSLRVGMGTNAQAVLNVYPGAILTNGSDVYVGGGNAGTTNFGALIINGGTVINGAQFGVQRGSGSPAQGRGELIVNGGFIQDTGAANNFSVGAYQYNVTNVAVATFYGGTLIHGTTANSGGAIYVGEGGSGTLNIQSGATVIVTNINSPGIVFNNTPAQLYENSTLNLNGGLVVTPMIWGKTNNGYQSRVLNFNGSTVKFNNGSPTNIYNLTAAYVWPGGATIDNGGNNITIAQSLLAPTFGSGSGVSTNGISFSGSGFIAPPVVDVYGSGSNATAVAQIDGLGNLTNVAITCPGVGYTGTPVFVFYGGGTNSVVQTGSASTTANASGSVTFLGSGMVTMINATNTFTGSITLPSGGMTLINSSIPTGVTVPSGAPLLLNNSSIAGNVSISGTSKVGGSGTIAGNVTWPVGSFVSAFVTTNNTGGVVSNSTPLAITGTVTFNNNTVAVNVVNGPLQAGTYILITNANNTIGGTISSVPSFAGTGIVPGTIPTVSMVNQGSSGAVILTVVNTTQAIWTNNVASSIWSQGTNWSTDPIAPNGIGVLATLGVGSASTTVTLDVPTTLGAIVLTNANNFVIANAGNALTLNNSGVGAQLNVVTGTNTIAPAITLNDSVNVNVSANQRLNISGNISSADSAKTMNLNGAGTVTLSGNNATLAGVTVNAGLLNIGSATALGTGTVTIGGTSTIDNQTGNPLTINNPVALNANVTFAGSTNMNLGTGAVTLGGNEQLTITTNTLAIAGNINGSGYTLTKTGIGTLTLSGGGTAGVTLSGGQLNINSATALGTGTFTITSSNNVIDNTSGGAITLANNNPQAWNSDFTFIGTKDLNTGNSIITPSGTRIITVSNSAATFTVAGVINGTGGLTKNGKGTLVLSNTNTYTGSTIVNQGIVELPAGGVIDGNNVSPGGALYIGQLNSLTSTNLGVLNIDGGVVYGQATTLMGMGTGTNAIGVVNMTSGFWLSVASGNAGEVDVGAQAGSGPALGVWNLSGGTNVFGSYFTMGRPSAGNSKNAGQGNGASRGELIMSGGMLSVNNFAIGGYLVTNWATSLATITGGKVIVCYAPPNPSVGGGMTNGQIVVGQNAHGVLNLQGGSMTISNGASLLLGQSWAGDATSGSANGYVNLNGGLMSVAFVQKGLGKAYMNFNGGTLQARKNLDGSDAPTFMTNGCLTAAYVYTNGAILDTSMSSMTIAQPLLAPTGNGVNQGTIVFGGSGFVAPPIVEVSDSLNKGTNATALALIDVQKGTLTNVQITCPGVNFKGTPIFSFFMGGGVVTNNGGGAGYAPNVSGGLTQIGANPLELDGINTYLGKTTINGNKFTLGGGGLLGGGKYPGTLAFSNANGTVFSYSSTNIQYLNGPVTSIARVTNNVNSAALLTTSSMDLSGGLVDVSTVGSFGGSGIVYGNVAFEGNKGVGNSGTNVIIVNARTGTNATPLKIVGTVTLGTASLGPVDGGSMVPVCINVPSLPLQPGSYVLMTCSSGFGGYGAFTNTPFYSGAGVTPGTVSVITSDPVNGVLKLDVSYIGNVAVWTNNVPGNWSPTANWDAANKFGPINPYSPQRAGDVAILGVGDSNMVVTLDTTLSTNGVILYTNNNSFTIADTGIPLTMDFTNAGATLEVAAGTSNLINTAVSLNDNLGVQLLNGSVLTVANVISNHTTSKTLTVGGANGGGTLALAGNNTYGPSSLGNPGTYLNGGVTLEVLNNGALGAGDLYITADSTIQAGTAVSLPNAINNTATTATVDTSTNAMTLTGTINGVGVLSKIGSGPLTLSANNGYGRPDLGTYVGQGTLKINYPTALGQNLVEVAGGATLDLYAQQQVQNLIILDDGGALANSLGDAALYLDPVLGTNGAVNASPGTHTYLTGNSGMHLPQISVNGGASFDVTNLNTGRIDLNGGVDNAYLNFHHETGTLWLSKSNATPHAAQNLWIDGGTAIWRGMASEQIFSTVSMSGAAIFDLNGSNAVVGNLNGSGGYITNTTLTPLKFQVGGGLNTGAGAGLFTGMISDGPAPGVINMIKAGTGTLALGGTNNYTGWTTISNGVFSIAGAGMLGLNGTYAGPITNWTVLDFSSTTNQTISGLITGSGVVSVGSNSPAGTLILSGPNTYSGATIVTNGTAKAGSIMAFGTGTVNVGGLGILDVNGQVVSNAVSLNNGATLINSSATASTNLGAVTVVAGSTNTVRGTGNMYLWQLTSSGSQINVTNTLAGTLDLAGTNDNNFLYLQTYTGTVLLDKTNAVGATAYHAVEGLDLEGGTVIIAGGLTAGLGNGDEIFDGGPLIVNGGTLDMNGTNETVQSFSGTGGVVLNNNATSPATLTLGNSTRTNSSTLQNGASGAGVLNLVKGGTGVETLLGVNTLTGYVQVRSGGTLSVTNISTALGTVSDIRLGGGSANGTLLYTGVGENSDRVINFVAITAGSGQVIDQEGSGLLKFTADLTNIGTVTNTLTLTGNTSGNGELAGDIPNGPLDTNLTYLVKSGTNTWTLSGDNNTAAGLASVNAGTLVLNGVSGTNWGGSVVVSNNATLGAIGVAPTVLGNVKWQAGSAAAVTIGSALIVKGTVTLNNNAIAVSSAASLTQGVYPLVSYNSGSSGSFNISQLTLNHPLPPNTVAGFGVSGGYLNLVIRSQDVWTNNGNGSWATAANWNPSIPNALGESAVLGVGASLTTVNLAGGKTVGSVTFTNDHSFIVTNSSSTLTMDNGGNGASLNVTAGTLNAIDTPVTMNDNTTLNVAGSKALALGGNVAGNAGVIVSGGGTASLNGSNSYTGFTTVNGASTLVLGNANAIGTNTLVLNDPTLDSSVPNLVNAGNNAQIWSGDISFAGSQNLNIGSGSVTMTTNLTLNILGKKLIVGGPISGAQTLTLKGTNNGILELDSANTFTGFQGQSGTVAIGNDQALGVAPTLQLLPNALPAGTNLTIMSKDATAHTITNNIQVNTFDGPYIFGATSGGTGDLIFSGTVASGNGLKRFFVNNNTTFAGAVTDNGAPTAPNVKDGPGTLTLTANNTSTKTNRIDAGTLALGNAGALGQGTLLINGGGLDSTVVDLVNANNNAQIWDGSFHFTGSQNLNMGSGSVTMNANTTITVNNNTLEIDGVINSSANLLSKSGNGTLLLGTANNNTGGVAVNAGTLQFVDSASLGSGTLTMNGGALDSLIASGGLANNQVWNGSFTYVGSTYSLELLSGASVTMSNDVTITVASLGGVGDANYLQVDGNIYGPTHSLTMSGPGALYLYGANTYSNTVVNNGYIYIGQATLKTNAFVSINSPGQMDLGFGGNNMVTGLFTNGVAVAPGLYNSGNLPAFFAADSGSLLVVAPPVVIVGPTGPGYLTNLLSGSTLSLSWPPGQGWILQAQTNSLSIGLSNNWHNVTDGTVSSYNATVNPTNPAVYYRLFY